MADKHNQATPLSPVNINGRSDQESRNGLTGEQRRKRNKKRLLYCILFVIFQTGVIAFFSLTVMKFKNPKFRVRSINSIGNFSVGTTNSPSFKVTLSGEFGVKNTNFGHFKYDNSSVIFEYKGTQVGEVFVAKARARARSTKKISFSADLSSTSSGLSSDIGSGIVTITSHSKLSGKIILAKLMKKKKSAQMNCTMDLNIATQAIQNLKCK